MQFAMLTPCKLRFINWAAVLIVTQIYRSILISKKTVCVFTFYFCKEVLCLGVQIFCPLVAVFSISKSFLRVVWLLPDLDIQRLGELFDSRMKIDRFRHTKSILTCLNSILHEICIKSLTCSFRLSISSPRLITSCSSWLTLGIWLLTVKLNVFTRFWKKRWI